MKNKEKKKTKTLKRGNASTGLSLGDRVLAPAEDRKHFNTITQDGSHCFLRLSISRHQVTH